MKTIEIDTQVFHESLHEIYKQSRGFLVQKTVYLKALLYMVVYSAYVFFWNPIRSVLENENFGQAESHDHTWTDQK